MVHRATQANGASEETSGFILVSMRAAWNAWVTKWDFQAIWQNDRAKSAVILARRHIMASRVAMLCSDVEDVVDVEDVEVAPGVGEEAFTDKMESCFFFRNSFRRLAFRL